MNEIIKTLGIRFLITIFDGVAVAIGVFGTLWLIGQFA